MASEAKRTGEPGWSWRKAIIFPIVIFACWRLMAMEGAADTMVNQTIAWGWVVVIIGNVFFYAGFATAQDIAAIMATRSGLPYSPQSSPAEPTPGTPVATDTIEGEAPR